MQDVYQKVSYKLRLVHWRWRISFLLQVALKESFSVRWVGCQLFIGPFVSLFSFFDLVFHACSLFVVVKQGFPLSKVGMNTMMFYPVLHGCSPLFQFCILGLRLIFTYVSLISIWWRRVNWQMIASFLCWLALWMCLTLEISMKLQEVLWHEALLCVAVLHEFELPFYTKRIKEINVFEILQHLDQSGVSFCVRMTCEDNAITNSIEIYDNLRYCWFQ